MDVKKRSLAVTDTSLAPYFGVPKIKTFTYKNSRVVRASDTDIAVILLYHCNLFQSTLWMEIGTVPKNK